MTPSLSLRETYALTTTHQTSTDLIVDPPYTPSFDGRTAPFEFSDFTYNTHNELRRHYATYQADWRLPVTSGAAGTHLLTTAVDWDGERALHEHHVGRARHRIRRRRPLVRTVRQRAERRKDQLLEPCALDVPDDHEQHA